MGYFLRRSSPISPVVTRKEYLTAVDRAFDALSRDQRRGTANKGALNDLASGRPIHAALVLSSLLERKPDDPTLHRLLGISYLNAGNPQLATRHLETALMLLTRATSPGISLLRSLRIEFEACVVRLALVAAYERLGHHAGVVSCLLGAVNK